MRPFLKICCLCLCLVLCLPCAVACSSKPTDETIRAETVVGTVDGKDVLYDELYFLATNYLPSLKEKFGDDQNAIRTELDRLVRQNILTNFAILKLCEDTELDYSEKEAKKDAEEQIKSTVTSSFNDDKDAYRASLAEVGLTERYLVYTTRVDLMYGRLLNHYPEQGLVVDDDDEIRAYIHQNFVRTVHVMNPNYEQISVAYNRLKSGEMTMFDAIGSVYNKDFQSVSDNGYYFTYGSMDEAYEKAAFALAPNEISDIVTSVGETDTTSGVCYYVIQRLPLEEDYITSHFSSLQTQYYSAVIYEDMTEIRNGLSFTSNDFYGELDLANLPVPKESSSHLWVIFASAGGVLLIAAAIVIPTVVLKKKYARKNIHHGRKS